MSSLSRIEQKGLIHLYTGGGKGKTTCAAGLCLRALGHGKTVLFCQFLKAGESGELYGLTELGAKIVRAKKSEKFTSQMNALEKSRLKEDHESCFAEITELVLTGKFDIVALDEIVDAVNMGLIGEDSLLHLVKSRPAHVEIIMTGRNPSERIKSLADYETDFVCNKHPFSRSVPARRGIEY